MATLKPSPSSSAEHDRMMHAPIPRLLLSLALPAMTSMLITSAASLVDSLTVSSLGTEATGAVGICFSLMACIQAVGFTLGMGGGSLISLELGRQDVAAASRLARASFSLPSFADCSSPAASFGVHRFCGYSVPATLSFP